MNLLLLALFSFGPSTVLAETDFALQLRPSMVAMKTEGPTIEGDILVEPEWWQKGLKGAVTRYHFRRWKNAVVPYVVDPAIPNPQDVEAAISHYHQTTAIRFIPRTDQKDYIWIKYNGEKGGCSSFIGRKGGKQTIYFPLWCRRGGLIHEFGHALGLFHEHTRADRNQFIKVKWNNIVEKEWPNFFRHPFSKSVGPFDFDSIMLYPSFNGFAKDKTKPTLTTTDGQTFGAQRDHLGPNDLLSIQWMYKR